MNLSP